MNRNKISHFFKVSVLGLFLVAGCTDLEVKETDSILLDAGDGSFVPGDPTALLSSAYKDLSTFCNQDGIYALYDHTSDEMIPPTRGTDWGDNGVWRSLHLHAWDATHAYVLSSWNQLNSRAYKCNQILASNPSALQAAEAKFLRAFYRFHVMDLYGQVPDRGVNDGVKVNPKVYTRSEAFDIIVKDLEEALPALPVLGPSATNVTASKAAANALLARLYLNKGVYKSERPEGPNYDFNAADMNKVIAYCDAVAADGYSLETEYFTNFGTSATKEMIFASVDGSPENRYFMTLHYDNDPSGWNGFTTLADFYDKFEANDQRIGNYPPPDGSKYSGIGRGFLLGQQYKDDGTPITNTRNQLPLAFTKDVPLSGASSEKGIRVIKYHPSNKGKYIFLRFGDVFLMKAEATFRGGTANKSALDQVNELRAIRGASTLSSLDASKLLDERGRELYWEGIRRIDQVRFGTFDDTWQDKNVTESFRVLYPVPQSALDSNPNLKQNQGY